MAENPDDSLLLTLEGHQEVVTSLVFSGDGLLLALEASTGQKVWSVEDLEEITTLSARVCGNLGGFCPGAGTSDKRSLDTTVRVWDLENGSELYRFFRTDGVFSVDISPNGSTAASGSWEDVRVWDFETAQELIKLK